MFFVYSIFIFSDFDTINLQNGTKKALPSGELLGFPKNDVKSDVS